MSNLTPRGHTSPPPARGDRRAKTREDAPAPDVPPERTRPWVMPAIRYVLPAVIVLAGIVFMAMGSQTDMEGGAAVVSAGLGIYLVNWLFRIGSAGDREREAEDAAREYYDRHGRWPA